MLAEARTRLKCCRLMSWPIVDESEPDYRHVTDKGDCQCQGIERRRQGAQCCHSLHAAIIERQSQRSE